MVNFIYEGLFVDFDAEAVVEDYDFIDDIVLPSRKKHFLLVDDLNTDELTEVIDEGELFDDSPIVKLKKKRYRFVLSDLDFDFETIVDDGDIFENSLIPDPRKRRKLIDIVHEDIDTLGDPPVIDDGDLFDDLIISKLNRKRKQLCNLSIEHERDDIATPELISLKTYTRTKEIAFSGKLPVNSTYITAQKYNGGIINPIALRAYYVPIMIPYRCHISELGIYCSVIDLAGIARLGVYSFEQGIVGELIYSNIVSLDSIGARIVGADISLDFGIYCLAYLDNSGIVSVKSGDAWVDIPLLGYENIDTTDIISHYYSTEVWSNGLLNNPNVSPGINDVPLVYMRVQQ